MANDGGRGLCAGHCSGRTMFSEYTCLSLRRTRMGLFGPPACLYGMRMAAPVILVRQTRLDCRSGRTEQVGVSICQK